MRRLLPLNPDAALLILRVVLAIIMLYHGWPKLTDLGGTIEAFTGMGAPLPALSAIFATVAEVGGGLLLLIGALTDIAGLLFAIEMAGAITLIPRQERLRGGRGRRRVAAGPAGDGAGGRAGGAGAVLGRGEGLRRVTGRWHCHPERSEGAMIRSCPPSLRSG